MTFLTREYEPELMRFLVRCLARGGVFVDVGAHVGLVSLSIAARCRAARVEVHAFEPDPLNAGDFARNLRLNPGLNVTLNQAAVGAEPGRATLVRGDRGERGCAAVSTVGHRHGSKDAPTVDVVTLDGYLAGAGIEHVAVMKLDVEGYEPLVLDGLERMLSERRVRCVVCEVNHERLAQHGWDRDALFARMERLGYSPRPIPQLGLRRLLPRAPGPSDDVAFILTDGAAP